MLITIELKQVNRKCCSLFYLFRNLENSTHLKKATKTTMKDPANSHLLYLQMKFPNLSLRKHLRTGFPSNFYLFSSEQYCFKRF